MLLQGGNACSAIGRGSGVRDVVAGENWQAGEERVKARGRQPTPPPTPNIRHTSVPLRRMKWWEQQGVSVLFLGRPGLRREWRKLGCSLFLTPEHGRAAHHRLHPSPPLTHSWVRHPGAMTAIA